MIFIIEIVGQSPNIKAFEYSVKATGNEIKTNLKTLEQTIITYCTHLQKFHIKVDCYIKYEKLDAMIKNINNSLINMSEFSITA